MLVLGVVFMVALGLVLANMSTFMSEELLLKLEVEAEELGEDACALREVLTLGDGDEIGEEIGMLS
jgi:hypothetical protein